MEKRDWTSDRNLILSVLEEDKVFMDCLSLLADKEDNQEPSLLSGTSKLGTADSPIEVDESRAMFSAFDLIHELEYKQQWEYGEMFLFLPTRAIFFFENWWKSMGCKKLLELANVGFPLWGFRLRLYFTKIKKRYPIIAAHKDTIYLIEDYFAGYISDFLNPSLETARREISRLSPVRAYWSLKEEQDAFT